MCQFLELRHNHHHQCWKVALFKHLFATLGPVSPYRKCCKDYEEINTKEWKGSLVNISLVL